MDTQRNLFTDDDLERWRPIADWPGYEISDWGRAMSYWGAGGKGHGSRRIGLTGKIIGGYVEQSGHLSVCLYRHGSKEKRRAKIHTLVLEAFVGPRPPSMWALHNDGNPANNRLDNLRWDTSSANQHDALRHGDHGLAKLVEADIPRIWERVLAGESDTVIGRDWGVGGVAISAIRSGKTWSHVACHLPGWPILTEAQKVAAEPVYVPDEIAKSATEIWRLIPDWPAYRVSNRGRVQTRWEKVVGGRRGQMRMGDDWYDRTPSLDSDGYLIFSASNGPEHRRTLKVHRCVLEAFAGPCPSGMVACHIDGNRVNNDAGNLRWDASRRNVADREHHRTQDRH